MDRKTKVLAFRWIKPHHLIILMVASMTLGILISYGMSVGDNHVEALFPYISDTGAKPPASCVFGLFLSLGGMFAFFIIYLRHSQYEKFYAAGNHRLHIVNDIAMFLGFLAAFGALLVANFQEVNVIVVHIIGALLTFVLGVIYCWVQNYLSWKVNLCVGKCVLCTRFSLSIIATICFILSMVTTSRASHMLTNCGMKDWKYMLNYKKDYPGYKYHLAATFSEWIMVFSFIIYFATFYKEFQLFGTSLVIVQLSGGDEQQEALA